MAGNTVVDALFYLRTRTLQNLLLSRLRRLKQPKYLMGAVIGVAYLYFFFFRQFTRRGSLPGGPGGRRIEDTADDAALFALLGASGLLAIFALCWMWRRDRASLTFSEAEIAFLFPAPVSRRALIHYRLLNLALAGIFSALVLALVSSPWPGMAPHALMRIVGFWVVFATVSLHIIGSGFALTRLRDRGLAAPLCQLWGCAGVALVVGPPLAWLWHAMQAPDFALLPALQSGPVASLLLPFRWLLGPVLAADWHGFLLAIGPALVIYALHYLWVLQVQVGFEEASIAKAEKRAAKVAAMRAGNFRLAAGQRKARRGPFNLSRPGRPELAFLWKNLLSTAQYLRPRTAMIAAAVIVGGCLWFEGDGFFEFLRPQLAIGVAMIAGYAMLFGPQVARQDFRSDLLHSDILKSYPLQGWQVMLGELLTPAAILTVLLWLLLLAEAMLLPAAGVSKLTWLTPSVRVVATFGLALVIPLLCLTQLLIVNAAVVLFPAWSHTGTAQTQQGIEVMGQRILFLAGQILAMALALLPAVLAAGVAFVAVRAITGNTLALGVAALLGIAVLAVMVGLGVWWLGGRFERLDLSRELRP
jgi:hypothetical protein